MKSRRLVLRGLVGYRRTHLAALATAALTAAVIVAALAVGDSVRASMKRVADARLGRVGFAAHARDRLWRADLAADVSSTLDVPASAALVMNGSAARPDGAARLARAHVLGVDDAFWALSPCGRPPIASWPPDGIAVSERVAGRLRLGVGDPIVLRVETPAAMPRDAPLASDTGSTAVLSGTVAAVLGADGFGRFSLEIGPVAPAVVFVPLAHLQRVVDAPGRANTLLVESGAVDRATVVAAVSGAFVLDDAGLFVRRLEGDRGWNLGSRRVFVDPPAAEAALAVPGAAGVLTWLVNDLSVGDRHTPYSLVAALPPSLTPGASVAADGEIVVNSWLAEDLGARVGDTTTLAYYVLGDDRRLEERTASFRIAAVWPLAQGAPERDLMPDIPGLTGSENCRDWDPGFTLNLERIRDRDEAYWDEYAGTPKAFIPLSAGQALWANRFGALTAVRFPADLSRGAIESAIRARLDPADFGLVVVDVREEGERARAEGMDFGMLFLGFSAFLVIAALVLTGLVAAFNVAMRRPEIATLRALGFPPRRIRRIFAAEHAIVALAGAVPGAGLGLGLAAAALGALDTVWADVAGSLSLELAVRPFTLLLGALAGGAVSFGVAGVVLGISIRSSVVSGFARREDLAAGHARTRARRCFGAWFALVFAAAAAVMALTAGTGRDPDTAGVFFASGATLLCAALSLIWYALAYVGVAREGRRPTSRGLAWRNLGRRRGRSLATVGVLAFGVFMFFGVTVFRRDRLAASDDAASGTGGFALVGESATAIVHDLDGAEGRRFHALSDDVLRGVHFVGIRVREGDDASCRSLARAQAPAVMGVDPAALTGRFTFVQAEGASADPWDLLGDSLPDGTVPAVIDQATFWTLGKGLGEDLDLTDEAGRPFPARIAGVIDNSILHGHVVISEDAFRAKFPSESGHRRFLVEAPPARTDEVAAHLTRQLDGRGMSLVRSEVLLNGFNAVENTYLAIFQALGALALILGSVGLALVVARNCAERRPELALLGAVGFSPARILRLVFAEHVVLLGLGIVVGLLASLLSVVPALLTPGARAATPMMALSLVALGGGGMFWTWLATRSALAGPMLDALREE